MQPLRNPRQEEVDDLGHLFPREGVEDDDLVHPVQELGPESLLEPLQDHVLHAS